MTERPIRFLHAGDFHLERVVGGLAEVPDGFARRWESAVWESARKVFDLAVEHEVDLVLLAGDILDARLAGPAGIDFLQRQFRKLSKHNIHVYWVAGEAERRGPWPARIGRGENVTFFESAEVQSVVFRRDGRPAANIVARSGGRNESLPVAELVSAGRSDLPQLAVAYGRTRPQDFRRFRLQYAALGGRHRPGTVAGQSPNWQARYAGPPQALCRRNPGPRGCVWGEISALRRIKTRLLATDVIRWHDEQLELPPTAGWNELLEAATSRLKSLGDRREECELLVRWIVAAGSPLGYQLRRVDMAARFLAALQRIRPTERIWNVVCETSLDVAGQGCLEEDTILGEFLRASASIRQQPERLPDGKADPSPLADLGLPPEWIDEAIKSDPQEFWRQVELLGYDLLQPAPAES